MLRFYQSVHSLAIEIEETGINRFQLVLACVKRWWSQPWCIFDFIIFITHNLSQYYDLTSIDHLSLSLFHPNRTIASRIVSIIHLPLCFVSLYVCDMLLSNSRKCSNEGGRTNNATNNGSRWCINIRA